MDQRNVRQPATDNVAGNHARPQRTGIHGTAEVENPAAFVSAGVIKLYTANMPAKLTGSDGKRHQDLWVSARQVP